MGTRALIATGLLVCTACACADVRTCSGDDSVHFMQLPVGLGAKTIHHSQEHCMLRMITFHDGFSTQAIDNISATSYPTTWPHHIKTAILNLAYETSQNTTGVIYTPFLPPGDGKSVVAHNVFGVKTTRLAHEGRTLTWWKLKLISKLLADHVAKPEGSRGGCQWLLWIDADAFVAEPDADIMRVLANLPVSRLRFNASGVQVDNHVAMENLALVAARENMRFAIEFNAGEFLPNIHEDGHLNAGILLLNLEHPKLQSLIDAWWYSPLSGVCEPRFMTDGLQDQVCFNNLIRFNETTRATYSELVGEVDFVSLNSPVGRIIRHVWGEKYRAPQLQTLTDAQMGADGLLAAGSGRSYELLQLLRSRAEPFPAYS
eukprot:gnl/TRDRNA2_/TRDRNA2_175640_c0_seq3.p1 gnl/TRDRNA2_/TRDRNA2_175640_c0~~gnl/TRDRNA2_/TRDRNA2_175640_c0_seq3.p1  ORF type:complete len:373 (+),score=31.25 gnl/TRDRNA2_/TRDRNA2_175640_c0_seq3:100-1218(+)